MKIDQDYLKTMLEAFESAPAPVFYVRDFASTGLNYEDEEFVFHLGLLDDQGFVARDDRRPGYGLMRGADGTAAWSIVPLRLTAQGHEFLEALRNKEVWATIKREFKDASIGTLSTVAKKLAEAYAKRKIDALLNGETTFSA